MIISDTVYDGCIVTIEYKYKVGVTLRESAHLQIVAPPGRVNIVTSFLAENNTYDIGNGAR